MGVLKPFPLPGGVKNSHHPPQPSMIAKETPQTEREKRQGLEKRPSGGVALSPPGGLARNIDGGDRVPAALWVPTQRDGQLEKNPQSKKE